MGSIDEILLELTSIEYGISQVNISIQLYILPKNYWNSCRIGMLRRKRRIWTIIRMIIRYLERIILVINLKINYLDSLKKPGSKLKFKKNSVRISSKVRTTLHSKKMSKISVQDDFEEKENNVLLFVDIHGHSIEDNIFMYGCKGVSLAQTSEIKEIPILLASDLQFKAQEKLSRPHKANLQWDACLINQWTFHNNIENEARIFSRSNWKFSTEK